MRRLAPPSEISRLAAPVASLLDASWQRMHWWILTITLLYAMSGIAVIKPDEVAVVLRWGRLVGDTPALQEYQPGLLFSFPRPVDQVVRVQVRRVRELRVDTLGSVGDRNQRVTLNPLEQGYALTGDLNVVHVNMMARYRVRNPAEWAFYGPRAEDILRVEITAAMVRSLGEMQIDSVLGDGRKQLIATAVGRAQSGLDAAHSGLELSSIELTRLTPPAALAREFDAVQSAFIGAETKKKNAQSFSESAIPQAQAEANTLLQQALGAADSGLARARGESSAFLALAREYRANAGVVRERLYRDAVERAIGRAAKVRWVPPPIGGNYRGFRITIAPGDAGDVGKPAPVLAPQRALQPGVQEDEQ